MLAVRPPCGALFSLLGRLGWSVVGGAYSGARSGAAGAASAVGGGGGAAA